MIIGYTCGVFDLLHIGHINLLKNAKSMCDKLIVGLSTDECIKYKFKNTVIKYEDRKIILESIKYVDSVIPQIDTNKYEAWEKIKFNILFVGDDWYNTEKWNKFENQLNEHNVKVVYFPYTKACSTTLIKKKIVSKDNILILFNLDKTLWNFYTNVLTEKEYLDILKNYIYSDDIKRIFRYLNLNNIKYGFVSRSKHKNRCKSLLKKLAINLDEHLHSIFWTDEKTKLPHLKEIIKNSNVSPEFIILFDHDKENLKSVENIIYKTNIIDKDKNLTFEDFINILQV